MQSFKCLFTVAAVLAGLHGTAQQKPATAHTWTNRVSRVIPVMDSTYLTLPHPADSMLAWQLIQMALAGKVQAYKTYNSDLKDKFTTAELDALLFQKDTIEIEDPVTGEKFKRVVENNAKPEYIKQLRILEEWTFDQPTGTLTSKIVGLCILYPSYGDDGVIRGNAAIMWFRYADIAEYVYSYGKRHFDADLIAIAGKEITLQSFTPNWILPVRLDPKGGFDGPPAARPEVQYPALAQYIAQQAIYGNLKAWQPKENNLLPVSVASLKAVIQPSDTLELTDPVTATTYKKVVQKDMYFDDVSNFLLMGRWDVDEKAGTYKYNISAITPLLPLEKDKNGQYPAIWIKYTDFLPIIKKYEALNPNYNFALGVWNAMFK